MRSTDKIFALRYRRFMQAADYLSRASPDTTIALLARGLGRFASPYRMRAESMVRAMRDALGLDARVARLAWRTWLENHGLFAASVFRYASLDSGWLHDCIHIAQPTVLDRIAIQGGLVITCHCHHQNMVAARIGIATGNLSPLAASAQSSPLYPFLGSFIDGINRDSERWFGTGHYLFTDTHHRLVRETYRALSTGETVLTLCDTHAPSGAGTPTGRIFGRSIAPPTGAVSIAARLKVPIYAAIMTPGEPGKLVLHLEELGADGVMELALDRYLAFLETQVRASPASWQGWEWWGGLPQLSDVGKLESA